MHLFIYNLYTNAYYFGPRKLNGNMTLEQEENLLGMYFNLLDFTDGGTE